MTQNPIFIHLIHVEPLRNEKGLKKDRFFWPRPSPGTNLPRGGVTNNRFQAKPYDKSFNYDQFCMFLSLLCHFRPYCD